ncbi:MAG: hypothetical protein QGG48_02425 [Desulfatiglandales bacterium]|nr:hypothetical protein [Desulfatiglandales bacterium]
MTGTSPPNTGIAPKLAQRPVAHNHDSSKENGCRRQDDDGKTEHGTGPSAVVIPMKGFGGPPDPPAPDSSSKKSSAIEEFRRALRSVSFEGLGRFRRALVRNIKPEVRVIVLAAGSRTLHT